MSQSKYTRVEGIFYELTNERGRLGSDPESVRLRDGSMAANFSVAVDKHRYNESAREWEKVSTTWHQVSVYGAQAENVLASLRKGNSVVLSGRGQVLVAAEMVDGRPQAKTVNALNRGVIVAPDLSYVSVEVTPGMRAQVREEQGPYSYAQQDGQVQQQGGSPQSYQAQSNGAPTKPPQWPDAAAGGVSWETAAPGSGGFIPTR